MATWRASRNVDASLSILGILLALCLTGCDTLQSADSSPKNATPIPPPSAYHQVAVAAPPKAAPVAAAPAPAPVVKPLEMPIVHKTPEPVQTLAVPVRAGETKPAPPPSASVKGAETLVALSTSSQPHSGAPAPASQKSIQASAPPSEPQALFFKGPERPPPKPGHKFLWFGLGLGICSAAGGGLTWFRLNRNRQVAQAFPANKKSDHDDVDLPREFKVKERRVFVEEDPVTTDKS
jgi:hypothetical protein